MVRSMLAALALTFAALGSFAKGEEVSNEKLEKMLGEPATTGLMILGLAEGSQAQVKGMQRGDIVTAYNGTVLPDIEALRGAIQKAVEAKLEKVQLTLMRDGKERAIEIGLGPLGVTSLPVAKGKATRARPPSTGVKFDFAALKDKPQEGWYDFMMQGKKTGFEHYSLQLKDGVLLLASETAFDGGAAFPGIQHFIVTIEASAEAQPRILKASYAIPPAQFLCEGQWMDGAEGKKEWRFKAAWVEKDEQGKEAPQSHEGSIPAAPDLISDYMLVPLAAFMPRKTGECFHFTNLNLGAGDATDPAGQYVAAEEEVAAGGEKIKAWRMEQHVWGQITRTTWVDAQGRVLKNTYGPGAESVLTTKEKALANLPKGITPKTGP